MGVIEDLKKKISSFHKGTERFFDDRIKEATLPKAIIVFVIAVLVGALTNVLSIYNNDSVLLALAIKLAPQKIIGLVGEGVGLGICLFSVVILTIWSAGKIIKSKNKGSSANLIQISYVFAGSVAFFSILNLLINILSIQNYGIFHLPIGIVLASLIILLGVLELYALIVAMRCFIRESFSKTILVIFGISITSSLIIIAGGIILWYLVAHSPISPTQHNFSIMNHSDGSFTIEYKTVESAWGLFPNMKESDCNITFPADWQVSSEEEYRKTYGNITLYPKGVNRYKLIYKRSLWNTSNPESLHFGYFLPPTDNYHAFEIAQSAYERGLKEVDQKLVDSEGFTVNNSTLFLNDESGILVSDVSRDTKTMVKHQATLGFVDLLLVEFYYQAPYGKDRDFYYILNSIKCSSN
ncbi:hypothetical protein HY988_07380 [Candidatus Micrarchaeota archaeon]|nr:hypothetical protein [Candidatus Micrarchaeota archaeon]